MTVTPEEIGRMMIANAGTLDDDAEFNRWAKLGSKLIGMGTAGTRTGKDLSPEEQQVLSRAMVRLKLQAKRVA